MVSRLVTGVTWSATPPYWYTFGASVSAEVLVSQGLAAEGATGLLYSAVTWSDGAVEPVGHKAWSLLDEISEPSPNANVVAYAPQSSSNGESFWRIGVAVGATKECVSDVFVNWTVCGATVATSAVPLYLDLPDPTGLQLSAAQRSDAEQAQRPCPVLLLLRELVQHRLVDGLQLGVVAEASQLRVCGYVARAAER